MGNIFEKRSLVLIRNPRLKKRDILRKEMLRKRK